MLVRLDSEFLHSLQKQNELVLVVADVIRQVLILNFLPSLGGSERLFTYVERPLQRLCRIVIFTDLRILWSVSLGFLVNFGRRLLWLGGLVISN